MNTSLRSLSNAALAARLIEMAHKERHSLVDCLRHLAEADRRKDVLGTQHSSLFAYCTVELRMSRSDAGRRIKAARLLRRFPAAAPYLADGRLNLSTFNPLKEVLTSENVDDILARAAGRTQEEVENLVASLRPRPAVEPRQVVPSTKSQSALLLTLPSSPPVLPSLVEVAARSEGGPASATSASITPTLEVGSPAVASIPPTLEFGSSTSATPFRPTDLPSAPRKRKPTRFEPYGEDGFFLKLDVNSEFKSLFNQVRDALSHVAPNASPEELLFECMRRTLTQHARSKYGAKIARRIAEATPSSAARTPNLGVNSTSASVAACEAAAEPSRTPNLGVESAPPSTSMTSGTPNLGVTVEESSIQRSGSGEIELSDGPPNEESIPTAVKEAVYLRDGGCCAYVGENGQRCGSTWQLEFHHLHARARGGPPTCDNISLYCHAHNQLRARIDFGDAHMAQFSREARWDR